MPRSPAGPIPAGAPAVPAEFQHALDRALAGHGVHVPGGDEGPEGRATALLPVLHHLQDHLGFVPPVLVPVIAAAFNLSRAEVHGVVTYYHHFRHEKPGTHVLQICQAEACRACGGEQLMAEAERALHCSAGSTRDDGAVTLEAAYCLGLCAQAPSAMLDGKPIARFDARRVAALAAALPSTQVPQGSN